jgi:glucose-6-phosphate 1-dehydrogenase
MSITSGGPTGRSDALVLFGATGDLAKRKLYPALYHLTQRGRLDMPIIGVARSDWNRDAFCSHVREAVMAAEPHAEAAVLDTMCARLDLVCGDYASGATWTQLAEMLGKTGSANATFYLAIPPSMFPIVVQALATAGLNRRGRVVVEKPFGRDLTSAQELNRTLHEAFDEQQIFRIDHYLGKESVEDLLVFRFSNTFLEPIWNRRYVSNVQITMAETIGVEGRGAFYDSVGALRDVVQNHLLQVVALLAMEPPVGPDSKHLQDEKVKVFAATRPIETASMVRGQYEGYLNEPGVAPGSTTDTFAAVRLEIESWRWAGVPWYLRAGKGLANAATEAVVELTPPPRFLFDEDKSVPTPNLIRFRLGNNDGVTLTVQAKTPGPALDSEDVELRCDFAAALGNRREAYERLLDDAIDGNHQRFAREDAVEETWRIVQPALDDPGPVYPYVRGSWGPAAAESLVPGGWRPTSS